MPAVLQQSAARRHPLPPVTAASRALRYAGEKWTLTIVEALATPYRSFSGPADANDDRAALDPLRFVEVQRKLGTISTEQLRARLNRMVEEGFLNRERLREVPPRVNYTLTDRARDLLPALEALAAWGHAHTDTEGTLR